MNDVERSRRSPGVPRPQSRASQSLGPPQPPPPARDAGQVGPRANGGLPGEPADSLREGAPRVPRASGISTDHEARRDSQGVEPL